MSLSITGAIITFIPLVLIIAIVIKRGKRLFDSD
jgi:integral membrane sensor domain MASE1